MVIMNLLFFILFALLLFLSIFLGGKKFRTSALYALAIGSCVNANFFNAQKFPIDIFNHTFGIDSILFTLFIFCVIVLIFEQGKKQAYILGFSSIIAIMLCAVFDVVARSLSEGYKSSNWIIFNDFLISSLVSVFVVVITIELVCFLRTKSIIKNDYLLLIIGLINAVLVNSPLYYLGEALAHQQKIDILEPLITSWIGEIISCGCGVLTLLLLKLYDSRNTKKDRS